MLRSSATKGSILLKKLYSSLFQAKNVSLLRNTYSWWNYLFESQGSDISYIYRLQMLFFITIIV